MLIREYRPEDEQQWLRCRVISFLDTSYYCDVKQVKEAYTHPSIELVAEEDGSIIGLMDIEMDSDDLIKADKRGAVLWHMAVLPEYRRRGVAAAMWERAKAIMQVHGICHCEAWTQEDEAANRFYCATGFKLCTEHTWLRCEASADTCDKLLRNCVSEQVYGAESFVFDAPLKLREVLDAMCGKMTEVRLYRCNL